MRRSAISAAAREEESEINLTPMLDVVFIMLIFFIVTANMDGRRIDVRQVKANVIKLLADNPQGTVVIQADEEASADAIIKAMDGARDAGVYDISLAADPK